MNFNSTKSIAQTENFSLELVYPTDLEYFETISQFVSQAWAPLLVNVERVGLPRPLFLTSVRERSWDIVIASFDTFDKTFPPLSDTYSPSSGIGDEVYNLNDTQTLSRLGLDRNDLISIFENYQYATTKVEQIDFAREIQQLHANSWLFDIPLFSQSIFFAGNEQFIGFDVEEGIIKSIFKGAQWESNPSLRRQKGRQLDELQFNIDGFNEYILPIYKRSRSDDTINQALFPSLMFKDENGINRPNLAVKYNFTDLSNGRSKWVFNLRNNAQWSDGSPIDVYDVKFTLDMVSEPRIIASANELWKDLEEVSIINETSISLVFSKTRLSDANTIADQYIVPEHILNTTITLDDNEYESPYHGGVPFTSRQWQEFSINPITGGPFTFVNIVDGQTVVLTANDNYWFPNELDLQGEPFEVQGVVQDPLYFVKDDQKIDSLQITKIEFQYNTLDTIDQNTERLLLESGAYDFIEMPIMDANDPYIDDSSINVYVTTVPSSGYLILFNLANPMLDSYEIRKALTLALNRKSLAGIVGYGLEVQQSPVSQFYNDYYDPTSIIDFDYDSARDIFVKLGFDAYDEQEPDVELEYPWERVPFNFTSFFAGIMLLGLINKKGASNKR